MKMSQKEKEKLQVEAFLKCLPKAPCGELANHECPDFLLKCKTKTIGMELTDCHHPLSDTPRPRREQESLQRRVLAEAKSLYESMDCRSLSVRVHFGHAMDLRKQRIKDVAKNLVAAVSSNLPENEPTIQLDEHELRDKGFSGFMSMQIRRLNPPAKSCWSPCLSAVVSDLTIELIQEHVKRKDCRVREYRKHCGEVWLLLLTESDDGLATSFGPPRLAKEDAVESSFDRVYLFRFGPRELWSIPVTRLCLKTPI